MRGVSISALENGSRAVNFRVFDLDGISLRLAFAERVDGSGFFLYLRSSFLFFGDFDGDVDRLSLS